MNTIFKLLLSVCFLSVCINISAGRAKTKKGQRGILTVRWKDREIQTMAAFQLSREVRKASNSYKKSGYKYQQTLSDIELAISTRTNLETVKHKMRSLINLAKDSEIKSLLSVGFAKFVATGCFGNPTLLDNQEAKELLQGALLLTKDDSIRGSVAWINTLIIEDCSCFSAKEENPTWEEKYTDIGLTYCRTFGNIDKSSLELSKDDDNNMSSLCLAMKGLGCSSNEKGGSADDLRNHCPLKRSLTG
ncbi:MAG TPA: hypothetical protein QGF02_00665 [Candidatus Babeliales bacterium]|nr:hypothetical protein [Candidatus Babeliales bacterium]